MSRKSTAARTRRRRSTGFPLLMSLEPRWLFSTINTMIPSTVRSAYGFDQAVFVKNGNLVAADGTGQTIAIVTAFDAPTIGGDVDVFDRTFALTGSGASIYTAYGASSTFLTKHAMSTSETADASWAQEASLDVEWAHAIAPGAHILLVEAASDALTDLIAAVNYAREQTGVSVVSMSWGTSEYPTEWVDDNNFLTPTGHQGVTFVTSAGDTPGTEWPAVSPYVLSVGGTTMLTDGLDYVGEAAWNTTGGGVSSVETAPAFETALTGSAYRSSPDVAYDANPSTGFYVYDSTPYEGVSGWQTYGGTSAGAPQWSALIAIANQGRVLQGKTTLDGPTETLPAIDSLPQSDFHDITLGSESFGLFSQLSAGTGYDELTGRGTPIANRVIAGLVGWSAIEANVVHNTTNAPVTPPRHRFHRFDDSSGTEALAAAPGSTVVAGPAASAVKLPTFYRISLLPDDPTPTLLALI